MLRKRIETIITPAPMNSAVAGSLCPGKSVRSIDAATPARTLEARLTGMQ